MSFSKEYLDNAPDSHLQNPIRKENRLLFWRSSTRNREHVPKLIRDIADTCPVPTNLIDLDSEFVYGKLFSDIYNDNYPILPWVKTKLPEVWNSVESFLKVHCPTDLPHEFTFELTKDVLRLMSLKQNWECLRIIMQKSRMRRSLEWIRFKYNLSPNISICYVSQNYVIIMFNDNPENYWILDYEQVMMICDTIIGRVFSCIYLDLLHENNKCKLSSKILKDIYNQWDNIFLVKGNNSYKVFKNWEPLILGILLTNYDPLTKSNDFLKELLDEDDKYIKSEIINMKNLLCSNKLNKDQLGELHGIYRHWGHPTVNEDEGCKKVRKIACKPRMPNYDTLKQAKGMFCRQFCISFISEHGRWPRISLNGLSQDRPLYKVIRDGISNINFYSPRFLLKDWEKLSFLKEFEFDYHIDYTDVCEDKAISVYLDELFTIYAPEILNIGHKKPTSNRRLLIEILRRENINIKEICQRIMNRDIPEKWKVILVHAKEREMKIEPRLFAMFVLEMRLYYNVTESNISHIIFKYFPQQTMTLSETELTKRLFGMSKDEFSGGYIPIFLSIDFKSWNIYWQYLTTKDIFTHLDELFGTPNLYTYSHIFFSSSTLALSSRYHPPTTITNKYYNWMNKNTIAKDDPVMWCKHYGGLEGIRQKGWTLITIILLLLVEIKTGIKGYIIGQGDNQFLKLMVPIEGNGDITNAEAYIKVNQIFISENLESYMRELVRVSKGFCLIIKSEESWFSSCIVSYGKDILFNGAYMSQGLKRISRVMPDINDLYPTLLTKIGSMQTTGLSTAQKMMEPWVPYFICQVETILMCERELMCSLIPRVKYNNTHKEWLSSQNGISFILHGDTNIHSIPVQSPYNYIFRGHPDPLTSYLTMLDNCRLKCIYCQKLLLWLITKQYEIGDGDPELLISDPSAINIKRPTHLSKTLKSVLIDKVKNTAKNIHIRSLFHLNCEQEDKKLYEFLITTVPLYPRLLHEIVRQTVTSTRNTIIAKFASARTIQNLLTYNDKDRFFKKLVYNELAMIDFWRNHTIQLSKINANYKVSETLCPTNLANAIRNHTWSKTTNGQSICGVTVPYPLHQFTYSFTNTLSHSECRGEKEYILFKIDEHSSPELCFTRGPYQPFHGHKTREKQSGKIYQVPMASRPLKSAERLVQLSQWCIAPSESMFQFIHAIIATRTNIPYSVLQLTAGSVTSGSQVHRLNDHITKQGVATNIRPNIASYIYLSTDEMGKYSRGSDNVNMHFQGALLTGIFLFHMKCIYSDRLYKSNKTQLEKTEQYLPTLLHAHYNCLLCEEYIPDTKITSSNKYNGQKIVDHNPLIYAHIEDFPNSEIPESRIMNLKKKGDPVCALASLIFSRMIINLNRTTWGVTQRNKTYSTRVSVRTILDVGIENVIDSIALLLYLYYYEKIDKIMHILGSFSADIWQDLGPACLLPEIIPYLHYLADSTYAPQLYTSSSGCARLLNKALVLRLRKLSKSKEDNHKNLMFFIVPGVGISRIFRMWGNFIHLSSNGLVDIRKYIGNLQFDLNIGLNLPSKDTLSVLENTITNHKSIYIQKYCMKKYPLMISRDPPEVTVSDVIVSKIPKLSLVHHTPRAAIPVSFINSTFENLIEFPSVDRENLGSMIISYDEDLEDIPLIYDTHIFLQVSHLSSAFLKILQIIQIFSIKIDNPCVALADGEGSIALLLYKLSGYPVIYNTKVDTKLLIPQRAVNYIPAEFIGNPEGVIGAPLAALLGGDLLNKNYVAQLIKLLPNKASVIIADPESSSPFTFIEYLRLLASCLKIAVSANSPVLIFKIYINNPQTTSILVGLMNTIYETVFLSVPLFSSHENYEAYLVGSGLNPVVLVTDIGKYVTPLTIIAKPMCKGLKSDRITKHPHMFHNPAWRVYLKLAFDLGYKLNLVHHLEKISGNYLIFTEDEVMTNGKPDSKKIIGAVKMGIKKLRYIAETEWKGLSIMTIGEQGYPLISKSSTSNHTILDNIMYHLCIYLTLASFLQIPEYYTVIRNYKKMMEKSFKIVKDNDIYYEYVLNQSNFKLDYLKSIWTIWGHCHLSFL